MRIAIAEAVEATVMREAFTNLEPAERFGHILEVVSDEIRELYPGQQIGLVSGIISSEGDENILQNIAELIRWRNTIAEALQSRTIQLPTLVSPFIFTELAYEQMGAFSLPRDAREALFQQFYRQFLASGLVSDIFMTPGYERSVGALDELATAEALGLRIHFTTPAQPLGEFMSV